jgi:hypothetical protein
MKHQCRRDTPCAAPHGCAMAPKLQYRILFITTGVGRYNHHQDVVGDGNINAKGDDTITPGLGYDTVN